jgi:4-aminobutyrate aminotransferase
MEMMDRDNAVPKVKRLPGPNAKKWTRFHMRNTATTTLFEGFVWDRTKPAAGPWCTDVDGNILLDFVSHIASAPLGYNHPRLIELMQRIHPSDPDRYAGTDFIVGSGPHPDESDIPTPGHLHEKVMEITRQFKFDMAFFSNSGSEAVENAIKVCYSSRKAQYGICFEGAFHGRTLGALSLNRSKAVHRAHYPQLAKVVSLPYCHCEGPCRCGWETISRKSKVENRFVQLLNPQSGIVKPEEVAYVIIEPLQGEGGYRIPRKKFIREVYHEAQQYGIPVISDEIQAGLGRTGKWWACEHFDVRPDLISSAKGLRVGATIGKRRFFPKENGRISSTWAEGNAIASAIGYTTIDIIQKEKLLQNAERMGGYFLRRLREIQRKHSRLIDVRGLGLMDAIELDTQKTRDRLQRECFKRGLVMISAGYKTMRLLPPLDVTTRELDIAATIIDAALTKF